MRRQLDPKHRDSLLGGRFALFLVHLSKIVHLLLQFGLRYLNLAALLFDIDEPLHVDIGSSAAIIGCEECELALLAKVLMHLLGRFELVRESLLGLENQLQSTIADGLVGFIEEFLIALHDGDQNLAALLSFRAAKLKRQNIVRLTGL